MNNIKRFLLDVIYPNKCPFCSSIIAFNEYYCCNDIGICLHKPEPTANITETFAIFEYNDATSPFVYKIKDGGDGYAVSAAAKILCEIIDNTVSIDLITCVPTDSARLRELGYNPPALIAREMSSLLGIKCAPKLLTKTRKTEIQKSLTELQRRENLRGAFALNTKSKTAKTPLPENILIIDDVRTTGATLSESAGALLSAGAKKVYAAVIAVSSGNSRKEDIN